MYLGSLAGVDDITGEQDTAKAALALAVAIKRIRARIREESGTTSSGLSVSQLAVLVRLINEGPATASALATAEHVSQQAIAQSAAALKTARLVAVKPDPKDRRKSLLSATAAGRRLIDSINASRDAWLNRAIESVVSPGERPALDKAIELLERLADADLGPDRGNR